MNVRKLHALVSPSPRSRNRLLFYSVPLPRVTIILTSNRIVLPFFGYWIYVNSYSIYPCVWLLLLNIMCERFIRIIPCIYWSFPLLYFVLLTCHVWFHPFFCWWEFLVLAITTRTYFWWICINNFVGIYTGMEFLDHRLCIYLPRVETTNFALSPLMYERGIIFVSYNLRV